MVSNMYRMSHVYYMIFTWDEGFPQLALIQSIWLIFIFCTSDCKIAKFLVFVIMILWIELLHCMVMYRGFYVILEIGWCGCQQKYFSRYRKIVWGYLSCLQDAIACDSYTIELVKRFGAVRFFPLCPTPCVKQWLS